MQQALTDISALLGGSPALSPPLRGTLDLLTIGVCIVQSSGEIVFINKMGVLLAGSPSDAPKEGWSKEYGVFYGPHQAMMPAEKLPLVRALSGEHVELQRIFLRNIENPDGIWLSCSAAPIRDAAGTQTGAVNLYQPTSAPELRSMAGSFSQHPEQPRGLQESIEVSETLRLLEGSTDGIWDWNLLTDEKNFSPRWKESLGYGDHDLPSTSETWRALIHPADRPRALAAVQAHLDDGAPYNITLRYRRRDGSIAWMRSRGEAIQDDTGQWVRMIGTHTDLTALKETEALQQRLHSELEERVQKRTRQLEAANEQLRNKNVELERFAYVASHDLQEPLRKILSFGPLLEERLHSTIDDRSQQYLQYMISGAQRMRQLIQDLLAYSRSGEGPTNIPLTRLAGPLSMALHNLSSSIDDPDHQVVIEGELPAVCCDPQQLTQLLQNILGNAAKYRSEERPLQIRISSQRTDSETIISIADNGIGIEPQYFEKIFEVFQRLHSRSRYSGTGIGLAICKRLMDRCGGRIWLDSVYGEGSTFYLAFPPPQQERSQ